MHDSVTVHMKASPDRVWALVSDVTRIGSYSPETFEAEWIEGATGPAVGAKFRGHVKRNGIGPVYWTTCVVSDLRARVRFGFDVLTGGKALEHWTYTIEPSGDGSDVTESFRLARHVALKLYWAVLGWARGKTNRDGMQATLEAVKAEVEEPRLAAGIRTEADRRRRDQAGRSSIGCRRGRRRTIGACRHVLGAPHRVAGRFEGAHRLVDAGHGERRVGLPGRAEVLLHPEVDPQTGPLEPAAAPDLELGRLLDPGNAEQSLVEGSRHGLRPPAGMASCTWSIRSTRCPDVMARTYPVDGRNVWPAGRLSAGKGVPTEPHPHEHDHRPTDRAAGGGGHQRTLTGQTLR